MRQLLILLALIGGIARGSAQRPGQPVRFIHGTQIFSPNYADVLKDRAVDPSEIIEGRFVRLIQFDRILTESEKAEFEAQDAKIFGYIHFGAYLVSLPGNFDFQRLAKFPVWSIQPYQSSWKIHRNLIEQPFGEWAVRGNQLLVRLQVFPHISLNQAKLLCNQNGIIVRKIGRTDGFMEVQLDKNAIEHIAALPFVRYMELLPEPGKPEDILGKSIHRSNVLDGEHALSKKYDGTGVKMMVRDDGIIGPHIDVKGRLTNVTDQLGPINHGDGVSGIMTGAGNLNPVNRGMAPGSELFAVDYVDDFQDTTYNLALEQGITITNTSYSNGCNAGYTLASRTVDQQLFQTPTLMHVFSAGNSNNVDCSYGAGDQWGNITGGHKMAKNAIATANIYADATLVESSSRGPAYDGRLKPDISANGQDQVSLDENNTYQVFGGTSGAAPGIAGCLGQLTHAYKSLNANQEPEAALLKATILNTANDLGNVGPDFKFGWGHINTGRALQLLEQNRWKSGTISQGETKTHTISIPAQTRLAKVMLYWAEPPAEELAAKALINDLDLRVAGAAGTDNLPWVLDPTPDAALLDNPATKGNDTLNNVEQVAISDPAAGTYTVKITGTEVPMGPVKYYIVWEYYNDNVRLTYPNGGEGLAPGDTIRMHWDAYGMATNFTLRYSTDNAANWLPLTTVTGEKRMFDWTVPQDISGEVRFLLIRGNRRDTSDYPSSIVPVPQNLTIASVCPDSMTLSWDEVNDTLSYDVYLLGEKYMEIVGRTDHPSFTFPIQNVAQEKWVAVRAAHANGMTGRRTIAIRHGGNLLNCPQPEDIWVQEMLSPSGDAIVLCGESSVDVSVKIKNEGLNPSSGATIYYQANGGPIVTEALPNLASGELLDFTFGTPLSITQNGDVTLKVWAVFPGDDATFNDTIVKIFPVSLTVANAAFTESFEGITNLPTGWTAANPDMDKTWTLVSSINSVNVVGADGNPTQAVYLNCFDYIDALGEEDFLYSLPVDLSNIEKPGLIFQLAHTGYNSDYADSLRVEVFESCDLSGTPVTIWGERDPLLSNGVYNTTSFRPNSAADWRTKFLDLSNFSGKTIVVRFASVNDYGNNIFLDNIGIVTYDPNPPTAFFQLESDTICRVDTLFLSAQASAGNSTYLWSFGSQSQPTTASGPGPHKVRYLTPGLKTIRLIVTNPFGADTMEQKVRVLPNPIPNFSSAATGLDVTFTNTSLNSNTFVWDFGDATSSTEASPVHTYAAPGTYSVKLAAIDQCTTIYKTVNITLTTAVKDLSEKASIRVLPNPTAGDFKVEMNAYAALGSTRFSLVDASGRLIKAFSIGVRSGKSLIAFDGLNLAKGTYQLSIQNGDGQQNFSIVVQ